MNTRHPVNLKQLKANVKMFAVLQLYHRPGRTQLHLRANAVQGNFVGFRRDSPR